MAERTALVRGEDGGLHVRHGVDASAAENREIETPKASSLERGPRKVCAWCQANEYAALVAHGVLVTHGICRACRDRVIREEFPVIAQKLSAAAQELPSILTAIEAARLARFETTSGFRAWARQWGVRPSGHGRWPRDRVRRGLDKEAAMGGRRRMKHAAA